MSSTDNAPVRPPQATFAAWLVILCAVYVVLSSIEALGTFTSLSAREAAAELIDQTPSLGLSVDQLLDVRRWATIASAVLAGVAAVLGFFAWRRDLAARRVLSVVAVPLFLLGVVNNSLSTMLIGVAVILLWREPVASWFAGRTPPDVTPRGLFALGQPTPHGSGDPEAGGAADWTARPSKPGQPDLGEMPRPRQASLAVALTWICATLSVVMMVSSVAVALADRDWLWNEVLKTVPDAADQGLTKDLLVGTFIFMAACVIALAVGTIVCAMGLLQRRKWGALGLLALCWFITVICGAGLLLAGALPLLLPGLMAVWVIVLVRSRETRVWVLTAPRADGSGPGQFPDQAPYQYPGPPTGPVPPNQQFPHYPLPPDTGAPVPPPAAPEGGRRKADVPVDSPTQSTQQNAAVPPAGSGHVSPDLNPHQSEGDGADPDTKGERS